MCGQWLIYCWQYFAPENIKTDGFYNMMFELKIDYIRFAFATITVLPICTLLFGLPLGMLADKYSRKWVLFPLALLRPLFCIIIAWVTNSYELLVVCRFLQCICHAGL